MGIALAAKKITSVRPEVFRQKIERVCQEMRQTRPTAVNLFWAVDRMKKVLDRWSFLEVQAIVKRLEEEALRIYKEDVEINRRIGEKGKLLIREGAGVLTHCNAGALATAGYGTAVGVIQAAWNEGKRFHVFADETRPLLQGARLTAWELVQAKIPVTVLTDNMAGWLMKKRKGSILLLSVRTGSPVTETRPTRSGRTVLRCSRSGTRSLSMWRLQPPHSIFPSIRERTFLSKRELRRK